MKALSTIFAFFFPILLSAQGWHFELPTSITNLTGSAPQYELIMQDDFEGNYINYEYWSKIERIKNSPQWRCHMSDNNSLYELKKGRLRLYARVNRGIESLDTAKYLTGGITSKGKVNIRYGKIEIRARIKGAQGCWPALWMGAEKAAPYPNYAEIDIMENINNQDIVQQSVHNNYTDKLKLKNPQSSKTQDVVIGRYNTYTVEILPEKIVLSVNGDVTLTYPKIETDQIGQFPFGNDNMYLMLDMQVGGKWVKTVNPAEFPAYMDIDWVKVYRLKQ